MNSRRRNGQSQAPFTPSQRAPRIGPIRAHDPRRKGPVPRDEKLAHVLCRRCGKSPDELLANADDDYRPSIWAKCCGEKLHVWIPTLAIIDEVVEGMLAMGWYWPREHEGLVHAVSARLGDVDVTRCGLEIFVGGTIGQGVMPVSCLTCLGA